MGCLKKAYNNPEEEQKYFSALHIVHSGNNVQHQEQAAQKITYHFVSTRPENEGYILGVYCYANNNPLKFTDPSGNIAWWVAPAIFAAIGFELGGAAASDWKEWNPANWNDKEMSSAITGAMVGAGVGLTTSWLSSAAGANVKGIYLGSSGGATTMAWTMGSNAIITSNINIISSFAQGRDETEIALSGVSGFVAGAIGGYLGFVNKPRLGRLGNVSQSGIKAMNTYTSIINGGLDRLSNSMYNGESDEQILSNTFFGAAEGGYAAYLGNHEAFTKLGPKSGGYVGRYISSMISGSVTSVPGLGVTLASYQASYYTFVDKGSDILNASMMTGFGSYPLLLGTYINRDKYSSAIVDPFSFLKLFKR